MLFGASKDAFISFQQNLMDEQQQTIGLSDLLIEVEHDLDEFRKKHSNDYGVKNITMWWELERERLLVRHGSFAVVRKIRRAQTFKRLMAYFFAGWILHAASYTS